MKHWTPVIPVLSKVEHGYAWEDEGYPYRPMTYRLWIDDPHAKRCRIQVATMPEARNEKIVELNNIPTTARGLKKALMRILLIQASTQSDIDWLYNMLSQHSLRYGVDIDEAEGRRRLIPSIREAEIERMCDRIVLPPRAISMKRKILPYGIYAILFLLTAFLLCEKFAKNF